MQAGQLGIVVVTFVVIVVDATVVGGGFKRLLDGCVVVEWSKGIGVM